MRALNDRLMSNVTPKSFIEIHLLRTLLSNTKRLFKVTDRREQEITLHFIMFNDMWLLIHHTKTLSRSSWGAIQSDAETIL